MTGKRLIFVCIITVAGSVCGAVDLPSILPIIDPAAKWTVRDGVLESWSSQTHPAPPTAEEIAIAEVVAAKAAKIQAIKARTIALVETGTFAYGGQQFGLDSQTRSNWVGAISAVNAGLMQYPRQVTSITGARVTINSDTEAKAFYASGVAAVAALEESAYALVDAVLAATTLAQVEAVTDTR